MFKNAIYICAIGFFLSSCAQSPQESQKQQAAIKVYFECLVKNARNADDKASDAATIAKAISSSCIDLGQRAGFYEFDPQGQLRDTRYKLALNAVLYERKNP